MRLGSLEPEGVENKGGGAVMPGLLLEAVVEVERFAQLGTNSFWRIGVLKPQHEIDLFCRLGVNILDFQIICAT